MSAAANKGPISSASLKTLELSSRSAITYFHPLDDREAEQAPLQVKLIRRMFGYTRPYRRQRALLFLLTFLRGAQLPALAWMIGATINGPIAHRDPRGIWLYAFLYLLLALAMVLTLRIRVRLALGLGEAVAHDMRSELFRKLNLLPMSFFNKTKFGSIISRLTSDIDGIRVAVQDVAFVVTIQTVQMLAAACLMAWYNWILFSLMLLLVPGIWALNQRYRKELSSRLRRLQETWSRLSSTLAESVGGIKVTQAFVRQEVNAGFFRKLVDVHGDSNIGVARATAVFMPLLQLKTQLFLGAMALVSSYGALRWQGTLHMDPGDLVMFFFLANFFFEPVQIIGNQYNQALTAMAGAERLFRLLDLQPAPDQSPNAKPVARLSGRVEFHQVHFAYDPGRPVLTDISFVAEPGQTIALVGHTGSGKTTVVSLVQKLYLPTQGKILFDRIDAHDIATQCLRSNMATVQQNNFLFAGSVCDNIRFARPEATEADVRRVLKALDCEDLLDTLPQGLETKVGEKSSGLSAGQAQLICFARALLADARILVLDEATSAIDSVTEDRLQRALEVLLRNRTSFIVAHRLSTIRKAGLVLVLEEGRITERGTHSSLLQAGGAYAQLHEDFTRRHTEAGRTSSLQDPNRRG